MSADDAPLPERELRLLLAHMEPHLSAGEFVFCSLAVDELLPHGIQPLATFWEREGLSVIVTRQDADRAGWPYDFVARMITLWVQSSLHAVGLIAAVAGRLARAEISVNPVAACFHDYLFVPTERAAEALRLLEEMARAEV